MVLLLAAATGQAGAQSVRLAASTDPGTGSFGYTLTNVTPAGDSITTTTAGAVATSPQLGVVDDPGELVTITQAANAQFTLSSAACVDSSTGTTGIGALVGNTLTIAASNFTPTAVLLCTFENTQVPPDLAITKTANVSTLASGGTVVYTLVASNVGPVDVANAVLSDLPGPGLSCTTAATCTASGGASCPGSLPPGDLFGAGATVPSLPSGGSIEVEATCTVTATGQ
jgi:uncharacterized repeat protein (TIGR01451 family)